MGRFRIEFTFWAIALAFFSIVVAAGLVGGFVFSVAQGAWIMAALFGVISLLAMPSLLRMPTLAVQSSRLVAKLDNLPDSPPPSPEQAQAMAAVGRFDDSIVRAPGIPLTDQVRLDRRKLNVLLDRLRATVGQRPFEANALVDQLDALIQRGKPVPLTDQIRIDRGEIYEVLDRMRATIAEER